MARRWKKILVKLASDRGYRIAKTPVAILQNPKAELRICLRHVIALQADLTSDFFFVQIGAFDGMTNDPIQEYVRKYHWKGLLVEPQKKAFDVLLENYKDQPQLQFENIAVYHTSGRKEMFKIRSETNSISDWRMQQATFVRTKLLHHKRQLKNISDVIEAEPVMCLSLHDLLEKRKVSKIDLLQIDAEGYDFEIIRMMDFTRYRPYIIHYEHQHLSPRQQEECWETLVKLNYLIAVESSVDTLAYLKNS